MTQINIRLEDEGVRSLLREVASRAGDLRPIWAKVDPRITDLEEEQFRTEGGPTGGWPPLNPLYRALKARTRGWRTSIMQRTGRLMDSLVNPFHPMAVHRVEKMEYERGTRVPYAAAHQSPRGGRPRREVVVWRDQDTRWLTMEIRDYLTKLGHGFGRG